MFQMVKDASNVRREQDCSYRYVTTAVPGSMEDNTSCFNKAAMATGP